MAEMILKKKRPKNLDLMTIRLPLPGILYLHHFYAGIRYLLLDMHKGIDLASARLSSKIVFAVSIALTLIIGGKVLW